jgi:hypothetical protein
MTDETKEMIGIYLSMMKTQMKKDGLIFGIVSGPENANDSRLCFLDKEEYMKNGEIDGFMINLSDLNKGLL